MVQGSTCIWTADAGDFNTAHRVIRADTMLPALETLFAWRPALLQIRLRRAFSRAARIILLSFLVPMACDCDFTIDIPTLLRREIFLPLAVLRFRNPTSRLRMAWPTLASIRPQWV